MQTQAQMLSGGAGTAGQQVGRRSRNQAYTAAVWPIYPAVLRICLHGANPDHYQQLSLAHNIAQCGFASPGGCVDLHVGSSSTSMP